MQDFVSHADVTFWGSVSVASQRQASTSSPYAHLSFGALVRCGGLCLANLEQSSCEDHPRTTSKDQPRMVLHSHSRTPKPWHFSAFCQPRASKSAALRFAELWRERAARPCEPERLCLSARKREGGCGESAISHLQNFTSLAKRRAGMSQPNPRAPKAEWIGFHDFATIEQPDVQNVSGTMAGAQCAPPNAHSTTARMRFTKHASTGVLYFAEKPTSPPNRATRRGRREHDQGEQRVTAPGRSRCADPATKSSFHLR